MKLCYYARPISIDGTPQCKRDLDLIQELGFTPYPVGLDKEKALERYREIGMDAFRPYVEACSALVFRSFVNGRIGAGVYQEIEWARSAGIPVLEFPSQIVMRRLSIEETRATLAELGQR
jgi:hypothetical protein